MAGRQPEPLIRYPYVACWLTLVAVAVGLGAVPTSAQSSRQDELAKLKAEKAQHLRPNLPERAELIVERVEGVFMAPAPGWAPAFGGFRPGASFPFGAAYRVGLGEHGMWTSSAGYSVKNFKRFESRFDFDRLAEGRVRVGGGVRWEDAPQLKYFGLGPSSLKANQTSYGLRETRAGVNLDVRPIRFFKVGGGVDWITVDTGSGDGSNPSIEEVFDETTAPGLSADPTWLRSLAYAGIDWREAEGYTRSGGLYQITWTDYNDRDGNQYNFSVVTLDVRQFVPLLRENWVIGARLLARVTDLDAGQVIPHFVLPYVGGGSTLRGFSGYRFTDRHTILLNTEVRWTPSRFLDMAIFLDQGKAVADRRDLDFTGLKSAWGIGARFHGPEFTALRLDVGRSNEGIRLHIGASTTF